MLKGKGMNNLVHPKSSEAQPGEGQWTEGAKRTKPKEFRAKENFFSGTYHEVVELRRPGHELWLALSHADFHKSGVLAGLGLPHLTHDPEGENINQEQSLRDGLVKWNWSEEPTVLGDGL